MDERKRITNNGVELILNAIYVVIIICSYIIITDTFSKVDNNDYKASYVSGLILVMPCIIDGIRELLNDTKKQKLLLNIIDFVFGFLSFLVAACFVFAIIKNANDKIFASVIVYGSIVCVFSYVGHLTFALIYADRKSVV